ncbi:MAG: hypothetical protein ABIO16_07455 [Nocardioides sp.]
MTDDLAQLLSTWTGRRAFGGEIAGLLRRREYDQAEKVLVEHLTAYPGPIATACRGVADGHVVLGGWEEVDADLVDLCRRDHAVTAVGLDLSNYSDEQGHSWWDKEPVVELAVYTDEVYPFSESRRQDLMDLSETYPAPWTDRALGEETAHLTVSGLRALNGALLNHASAEPWNPNGSGVLSTEAVAEYLGWWFLHLRFHQAVARDLDERGLAFTVPVLVGTHDVGPWVQAVHLPAAVSEHEARTEEILQERARSGPASREAQTEETVSELRAARDEVRRFGFFGRGTERKAAEDVAAAKVVVTCQLAGLPLPARPLGSMGGKEFEQWLASLRAARASA